MIPIRPDALADAARIAILWNEACRSVTGSDTLDITARLPAFNLRAGTGVAMAGRFALAGDEPVGYVVASMQGQSGWIDSLAVASSAQRQGWGSALLTWAEGWLREQGCASARLGASLRPYLPGYPPQLGNASWFEKRGYVPGQTDWDVAADLADVNPYRTSAGDPRPGVEVRMARSGDEAALREFFARVFPGRWLYEYDEHIRQGGHISDFAILITPDSGTPRIEAFCMTTVDDSVRPLDRFYLNGLPQPWGQAGPLGTSDLLRGKGYAALVINTALASLKTRGVRGCVIDWTSLTDFYARFGFFKYREYVFMSKTLR